MRSSERMASKRQMKSLTTHHLPWRLDSYFLPLNRIGHLSQLRAKQDRHLQYWSCLTIADRIIDDERKRDVMEEVRTQRNLKKFFRIRTAVGDVNYNNQYFVRTCNRSHDNHTCILRFLHIRK